MPQTPHSLQRYLDAGMHFTQMTQRRAEAIVRDLVRTGEVQRDQAQQTVSDIIERSRQNSDRFLEVVRRDVHDQMATVEKSYRELLSTVRAEVDDLRRQVAAQTRRATGGSSAPEKAKPAVGKPKRTSGAKAKAAKVAGSFAKAAAQAAAAAETAVPIPGVVGAAPLPPAKRARKSPVRKLAAVKPLPPTPVPAPSATPAVKRTTRKAAATKAVPATRKAAPATAPAKATARKRAAAASTPGPAVKAVVKKAAAKRAPRKASPGSAG